MIDLTASSPREAADLALSALSTEVGRFPAVAADFDWQDALRHIGLAFDSSANTPDVTGVVDLMRRVASRHGAHRELDDTISDVLLAVTHFVEEGCQRCGELESHDLCFDCGYHICPSGSCLCQDADGPCEDCGRSDCDCDLDACEGQPEAAPVDP